MKKVKWISLVLMILLVSVVINGALAGDEYISASEVSLESWMSRLPDEALITEINMPGTHDAGTTHMNQSVSRFLANCQQWEILGQLEHGMRVLDVRVVDDKTEHHTWNNLSITHACWRCAKTSSPLSRYLMLYDVIEDCEKFLSDDTHKDETVILYIAPDDKNKDNARKLLAVMRQECAPGNDYCLHSKYNVPLLYYCVGDRIPTLGEVRGKIVVLDDGIDKADWEKIKIPDTRDSVGQSYEMHYEEDDMAQRIALFASVGSSKVAYWKSCLSIKEEYLEKFLLDSAQDVQKYTVGHGKKPGTFVRDGYANKPGEYGEPGLKYSGTNINTGGCVGPFSPSIRDYSIAINSWLRKWNWKNGARYGWITMDHPEDTLTKKIIATNEVKTTIVTVEAVWAHDGTEVTRDILRDELVVGGQTYNWLPGNIIKMADEKAEKLEKGELKLSLSPKNGLSSHDTVECVHVGENHWKFIVYEPIYVTLHWDYVEPDLTKALQDGFFTAVYEDGYSVPVTTEKLRVYEKQGYETVLKVINIASANIQHGALILDLDPGAGYRYDNAKDRKKIDDRHWEFTLHPDAEKGDFNGTVSFDDNNDKLGLRPTQYTVTLVATGTLPGQTPSSDDPVLFAASSEPLTVDQDVLSWEIKNLPLHSGDYDLNWDFPDNAPGYYTGSHVKNGNLIDVTLKLHPLSDVEIRWEGDETDPSTRPETVELELYRKSTYSSLQKKNVSASDQWRTSFEAGKLGDDWALKLHMKTTSYEVEGPTVTADGKGLYYVCTKKAEISTSCSVYWYDGEKKESGVTEKHPTFTVYLHDGKEIVDTHVAGGSVSSMEILPFGIRSTIDPQGKPYYYTIQTDYDPSGEYFCHINGFDIIMIRKTSLTATIEWQDAASNIIEWPSWLTGDNFKLGLLEAIDKRTDYAPIETDPPVVTGNTVEFRDLPLGVEGAGQYVRHLYKPTADVKGMPGVISVLGTDSVSFSQISLKYKTTLRCTLEPVPAQVSLTVNAEDNGYHPEQAFIVNLKNANGDVVATETCVMEQNVGTKSLQLELMLKSLLPETYTVSMEPVTATGWTGDDDVKDVTFLVRLNPETNMVEAINDGADPSFTVRYTHDYDPITVEGEFPLRVINVSTLPQAPSLSFRFTPYVDGTEGATLEVRDGDVMKLSKEMTQPGEVEFRMEPQTFDDLLWVCDDTVRTIRVTVFADENGILTADYSDGQENTFLNTYRGNAIEVQGLVIWDEAIEGDEEEIAKYRPSQITLELTPFYTKETLEKDGITEDDVEVLDTLTVPVTTDPSQSFTFGERPTVSSDGKRLQYTVRMKPIPYYTSTNHYFEYSILNQLTVDVVHPAGTVEWLGETDESYRPDEVTVNLFRQYKGAEAKKINTITVKPDTKNIWTYDFGAYPVKDTDGNEITYSVEEEPVAGYTTQVNGFTVENTKLFYLITDGDGQSYILRSSQDATFTCDGPFEKFLYVTVDDQKVDPSNYTVAASPTVLTLNSDWLDGLTVAGHSICFCYSDGISNEGTFTILPAITLTKIEITTPPTKTVYTASETFDPTGMVVTATYSDGSSKPVTGYTFSPDGALATTDTAVTVSYTEGSETRTATQAITVNPPKPVAYKIIIGANQTIYTDAYSALFASDADFSKFDHVEVDGKTVAKKYYTAESGSTVIIFNQDYIKTLRIGKHKLTIVSKDGSASANFMVEAPLPPTGDNTDPALLMMLLLASVGTILLTTAKARKKN